MYINKWAGFSVSILCTLSAGLAYCFSLFSDQLKEAFGYDQRQIQAIGSATNLGGYASIVSGLFYDSVLKYDGWGPRATVGIGACLNIVGWVALWAASTGVFAAPFWLVVVTAGMTCWGGTWYDTACLVTNVRNFPNNRGTVVGLLKACVGLSASVYTSIYVGFKAPDAIGYLLYLAFIPAVVGLCSLPFINHIPYTQKSELDSESQNCSTGGRFLFAYQIMIALAVYLMATAVVDSSPTLMLSRQTRMLLSTGTIILALSMLAVPYGSGGLISQPAEPQADEESTLSPEGSEVHDRAGANPSNPQPTTDEQAPLISGTSRSSDAENTTAEVSAFLDTATESQAADASGQKASTQQGHNQEGRSGPGPSDRAGGMKKMPDMTLKQCSMSVDFWLLFLTCSIGEGSGLAYLNNLGQLVTALGGQSNSQAVFVSLFSVSSCAGRLLLGYVPERLLHAWGTPRCLFLIFISAVSAFVAFFTAFASLPLLFPASILAGFAFGAFWSLMATLTSDIFGLHHFASNYTFVQLAPATGGFGLGQLVGSLYEKQAAREGPEPGCHGQHCFRLAFILIALLNLISLASSAILYYRTRYIYKAEYEEVHQHDESMARAHRSPALTARADQAPASPSGRELSSFRR